MTLKFKFPHFLSLLLVIGIVIQYGCYKETKILSERKALSPQDLLEPHILDCHNENEWTKAKVNEAITGKWIWTLGVCPIYNEQNEQLVEEHLTLHFFGKDLLEIIHYEQVIQKSNWRIQERANGTYTIQIRPSIASISGRVLFCQGEMIFNGSYNSRCDNYFSRVE